jgi:dipeptidyl-peptidase-4
VTSTRLLALVCAAALLTSTASLSVASEEHALTIDWVFDQEDRQPFSLPSHRWVDEGVLMYDRRPAKTERQLQLLNPGSGEVRDLAATGDVLAKLNEVLSPEEPIEVLGWPAAVTQSGLTAAYSMAGNIVLVELESGDIDVVAGKATEESLPRFSPDGQWLAYVRDNDIYAWHIADREETRLTDDGSDSRLNGKVSWVYWEELMGRSERGFVWSPDSSAVAYLQSDESRVAEAHFIDIKPIELPRLKVQRYPQPGTDNPQVRAGVVSLSDQKTTWVDLGAFPYEYLPRIQWLPNAREVAVQTMNRAQTVIDVFIADATTGKVRHLLREADPAWIDVRDDLHFFKDGSGFLWTSTRSGSAQLYRYDMAGNLVNAVTDGAPLRSSGATGGQDRAISHVDEQAGLVFFTALGDASTQRHLYRVALDGTGLKRLTGSEGAHAIRFSPSGRYFVDAYSSVDQLPSLALKDREGGVRQALASVESSLAQDLDMQQWELFEVAASDGVALPAMMLKPENFDPTRRHPVLVYVYGGPFAPVVVDRWSVRTRELFHQMLADRGVVVLKVDNRSSAGRSHAETSQILKQWSGPVELNDMIDAANWLQNQTWVDSARIGIWGWSGGGTNTLSAMTGSDAFAAGIAVAPLTDARFYDTIYAERYMKRPQDNPEGYEAVSLIPKAKDLKGRLMIVHGTYDDNVHPQSTWAFADELIAADILFDMLIYPMRKHGISDDDAQRHLYRSMLDFWEREFALRIKD